MRIRPAFRAIGAIVTGLGVLLLVVGVGGSPGTLPLSGSQPGEQRQVPAVAAGWVSAEGTGQPGGPLRAGDTGGGAVTYLKFEVPDWAAEPGSPPAARLRLTATGGPLPGLVELVSVPDAGWRDDRLRFEDPPVLGSVVQAVWPEPDDRQVSFDVTGLLSSVEPGIHAFAVTVPPDQGHATFVGADGSYQAPSLLLPADATPSTSPSPAATPPQRPGASECTLGERLVPTCGALWGVAPDAHTGSARAPALAQFEAETGRRQHIYHAYHRGQEMFPTGEEVEIAAEGRILFLNWKPTGWSWARIARGGGEVDSYLDQLAGHINTTFSDPFFFTVHHEPENNVRPSTASGWEATDYAAMFRYVVRGLRDRGVDNLVTVMNHLAYVRWSVQPWFPDLYPGDDVVDWIAWNTYAYSEPGYGHGDFAEMVSRRAAAYPDWPGFYNWAAERFPDKPFMLAEWGLWFSQDNPDHPARFYDSVARQAPLFPRLRAVVYFDTPADQDGRDSRPTVTEDGLAAYQRLGARPRFQVQLTGPGEDRGYGP